MKKLFLNVYLHYDHQKIKVGELAHVAYDIYFEYAQDFITQKIEISPFKLELKTGIYRDKAQTFQKIFNKLKII